MNAPASNAEQRSSSRFSASLPSSRPGGPPVPIGRLPGGLQVLRDEVVDRGVVVPHPNVQVFLIVLRVLRGRRRDHRRSESDAGYNSSADGSVRGTRTAVRRTPKANPSSNSLRCHRSLPLYSTIHRSQSAVRRVVRRRGMPTSSADSGIARSRWRRRPSCSPSSKTIIARATAAAQSVPPPPPPPDVCGRVCSRSDPGPGVAQLAGLGGEPRDDAARDGGRCRPPRGHRQTRAGRTQALRVGAAMSGRPFRFAHLADAHVGAWSRDARRSGMPSGRACSGQSRTVGERDCEFLPDLRRPVPYPGPGPRGGRPGRGGAQGARRCGAAGLHDLRLP